jgi:hypothetical protein
MRVASSARAPAPTETFLCLPYCLLCNSLEGATSGCIADCFLQISARVQTYTYNVRPICDDAGMLEELGLMSVTR